MTLGIGKTSAIFVGRASLLLPHSCTVFFFFPPSFDQHLLSCSTGSNNLLSMGGVKSGPVSTFKVIPDGQNQPQIISNLYFELLGGWEPG